MSLFFIRKRTIFLILILVISFFVAYYFLFPSLCKIFFPLEYWELISLYSSEFSLDPFLVAAIINVESRFNADAVSRRGAKGLMQLMPETAAWIAGQLELEFKNELLYDPEYNIFLGCWYLSDLKKNFKTLPAVLAAYNGGRGNVKNWLEKEVWDGTYKNIENIPFKETRNFIKRVSLNHKIYKWLYGKNP